MADCVYILQIRERGAQGKGKRWMRFDGMALRSCPIVANRDAKELTEQSDCWDYRARKYVPAKGK